MQLWVSNLLLTLMVWECVIWPLSRFAVIGSLYVTISSSNPIPTFHADTKIHLPLHPVLNGGLVCGDIQWITARPPGPCQQSETLYQSTGLQCACDQPHSDDSHQCSWGEGRSTMYSTVCNSSWPPPYLVHVVKHLRAAVYTTTCVVNRYSMYHQDSAYQTRICSRLKNTLLQIQCGYGPEPKGNNLRYVPRKKLMHVWVCNA